MRPSSKKRNKRVQKNQFRQAYQSFNGVDIKAVFGERQIGTLQNIEYRITRNNELPTYTISWDEAGTLADYDFDWLRRIGNNYEAEQ